MLQVSQRGSTPRPEGLLSPGQVYNQHCLGSSMSRPVQDLSDLYVGEDISAHGCLRSPFVVWHDGDSLTTIINVLTQIQIWGIGAL